MADKHAPPPVAVTPAPATKPAPEPTNLTDREPLWTKAIAGALGALVTWAISRGILGESEQQLADVLIPIVAGAIVTWWARRSVTSVARAQDAIELNYSAVPGVDPKATI